MKRTIQRTLPLVIAAQVAGCGLTQSVTDGTKDVAMAVFYKKVKPSIWSFVLVLN